MAERAAVVILITLNILHLAPFMTAETGRRDRSNILLIYTNFSFMNSNPVTYKQDCEVAIPFLEQKLAAKLWYTGSESIARLS